jgi:hypothetical protein
MNLCSLSPGIQKFLTTANLGICRFIPGCSPDPSDSKEIYTAAASTIGTQDGMLSNSSAFIDQFPGQATRVRLCFSVHNLKFWQRVRTSTVNTVIA